MEWNTLAASLFGDRHEIVRDGDFLHGTASLDGLPITVIGCPSSDALPCRKSPSRTISCRSPNRDAARVFQSIERLLRQDAARALHRHRVR